MTGPLFSVVTPSYNQGSWIEGCINSVLSQGIPGGEIEHLIFDNVSKDQTRSIVERYPSVRFFSEPDRGQAHALNKGFSKARGKIICWLNADDQYPLGTLEFVRRELLEAGRDVIYGKAEEVYFDGRPNRVLTPKFEHRDDLLRWWTKDVSVLQPAVFFTKAVADAVGPLREDLHVVMDLEYWWRVSERYSFHFVDRVLAIQQRQPDSKTMTLIPRMYKEKQKVFQPLLDQAQPDRRWRNAIRARRAMGKRYLGIAQSTARSNRLNAFRFLALSLKSDPLIGLTPPFLKAFGWNLVANGR